eukprot:TRINITY_DN5912_c0_g2_i1.p1 TRINITY_DN5912_c0_g2~~TRINITY_DN5912_c0_g2_i1.p1  ORF type:complete len:250 (-),score=84.29 TRINITY_DN5912_c0_g2_i1:227-976(-)
MTSENEVQGGEDPVVALRTEWKALALRHLKIVELLNKLLGRSNEHYPIGSADENERLRHLKIKELTKQLLLRHPELRGSGFNDSFLASDDDTEADGDERQKKGIAVDFNEMSQKEREELESFYAQILQSKDYEIALLESSQNAPVGDEEDSYFDTPAVTASKLDQLRAPPDLSSSTEIVDTIPDYGITDQSTTNAAASILDVLEQNFSAIVLSGEDSGNNKEGVDEEDDELAKLEADLKLLAEKRGIHD